MTDTDNSKAPRKFSRRQILQRYPIDGKAITRLINAGAMWLDTNRENVNALNVFPVPDGDTGTNMMLTMKSALDEINSAEETSVGNVIGALAQGALMGARGNSGVILSQLWRGFSRAVDGQEVLSAKDLVAGFAEARDTAYKGVVRPVEGTILTVAKDIASATEAALQEDSSTIAILEIAVEAAAESVERTPDLLPVLKDAGVVDSGGKGLFFLLEGMLRWINGESLDSALVEIQPLAAMELETSLDAIEEGQDYEVIVDFRPAGPLDLQKFYLELEEMGTSIQVGEGDGMYRMHIHVPTENRYVPIDYIMELGTVTNVAIENLMAQMEELETMASGPKIDIMPLEPGEIGVVVVAPGPGIAQIFASLGVAAIIQGGQTMNPSTEQILKAFEDLPAQNIIILPNNKNIFMAAESTRELSVKNIQVIPSRTVPQGLTALLSFDRTGDIDVVAARMVFAIDDVESGEITTATRDADIDGITVKGGEIIGLHNGKMSFSSPTVEETMMGLLEKMGVEEFEIITLYYGIEIEMAEVEKMAAKIEEKYSEIEVEIQNGGQPIYHYIIAVE